MTLLTRYLVRQNIFLLFTILLVGTGLYILTDLFERLDDFMEAGLGILVLLGFFAVKLPTIISQILPAVFLLALVIQMNILERNREIVALHAGGVSPLVLVRFVFLYGVIWAFGQFMFSQVVGVAGEQTASRIWQEDVHGNSLNDITLKGLWFTEKNRVIHIGTATPGQRAGTDLLVYTLDNTGIAIDSILKAASFTIEKDKWVLANGEQLIPAKYSKAAFQTFELPIKQDLKAFQLFAKSGTRPAQLSLWDLSTTIKRLERAGSNVEVLRTAWHGKLSYAVSIVVMGLLALIVSQLASNIYKAVGLSLLIVFLFHSMNTLASSMGEKGLVSPLIGAWFADAFFLLLSTAWFAWPAIQQRLRR